MYFYSYIPCPTVKNYFKLGFFTPHSDCEPLKLSLLHSIVFHIALNLTADVARLRKTGSNITVFSLFRSKEKNDKHRVYNNRVFCLNFT